MSSITNLDLPVAPHGLSHRLGQDGVTGDQSYVKVPAGDPGASVDLQPVRGPAGVQSSSCRPALCWTKPCRPHSLSWRQWWRSGLQGPSHWSLDHHWHCIHRWVSENFHKRYLLLFIILGPVECGLTPVLYHNVSTSLAWIKSLAFNAGA